MVPNRETPCIMSVRHSSWAKSLAPDGSSFSFSSSKLAMLAGAVISVLYSNNMLDNAASWGWMATRLDNPCVVTMVSATVNVEPSVVKHYANHLDA